MDRDNRLGEFLTARRGRVRPSEHDLPSGGHRRVPGLRREEVALLAGLSADYYMRLEQGRDRNPSRPVLESLAQVLRLDPDAAAHLRKLASPSASVPSGATEQVSAKLRRMMDGWTANPALILGRRFDIIAANPLGAALFPATNLVRLVFQPEGRRFYPDWEPVAQATVAGLRAAADPADPELQRMVTELRAMSPEFDQLWTRHDVAVKTGEAKRIIHPDVGAMTLTYDTFTVNAAPGQQLVVYQAESHSRTEHALTLLGIIATNRETVRRAERRSPGR